MIRCKESGRADADRICSLLVGLSPWRCPPCARGEPWPESPTQQPEQTSVVWRVPLRFTSVMMLRFHVKHHHGQRLESTMKLKQATIEHAAMHGQFPKGKNGSISALDAEFAEILARTPSTGVVPHIHEDVEAWSIIDVTGAPT